MSDRQPPSEPSRHRWVFLVLFVGSLVPLLFLKLDEAAQLAGALALPLSVVLAALPTIPPRRGSDRPIPWRRYSTVGAAVIALVGAGSVALAVWQNTKDIPVFFSFPNDKPAAPWQDGAFTSLPISGGPPERNHLRLVVSLTNVNSTGDCEQTATLELTPVLDDRPKDPVWARSGQEADLSLAGAARTAQVKITLHYGDRGNRNCAVSLAIDKAVLHD